MIRLARPHNPLTWAATVASLACAPGVLWAQTPSPAAPDPAATDTLPTVTVTTQPLGSEAERTDQRDSYRARRSSSATGLSLSNRETPQSLSTLTRQQLDDQGLRTVNDAMAATPGVTVEKVETDRTYFTARGFDIENFQLNGTGLPFTNGSLWGDVDTIVYDHIDVLRGANGLLTGDGMPSATVNFVTKKPTVAPKASVGVSVGSGRARRLEGDASGALNADGSVRGRIVGATDDRDGHIDRNHKSLNTLYTALEVDLGPRTTLSLGWLEQESKAKGPLWGALPTTYSDGTPTHYDSSTSTAADWTWWNNKERRLSAELSHDLGDGWRVNSVLSHRSQRTDSELLYVFGSPVAGSNTGLYAYPSAFKGNYKQEMASVQASGPFSLAGRQHELSMGLNWGQESAKEASAYADYNGSAYTALNVDLANWDGSFTKPEFGDATSGSDFQSHRLGAFAAARFNVADSLKLITGARLMRLNSDGENYGVAHHYSTTRATPYVGAVWTLTPELSAYGSYTTIFKPQTQVNAQLQVLTPASGHNTEVGLKSELLARKLELRAALFRTQLKGLANAGTWSSTLLKTVYEGEDTDSQGVELEAVGRLGGGVEVSASYTHQDITNAQGEDTRTFVPRDMAKAGLRYQATDRLSTTAAVRWQSRIYRDDSGTRTSQSAYALLDLGLQYQINQNWRAGGQLRNVTNQRYLNSLYWSQAYYGAPRSGELSVHYTF